MALTVTAVGVVAYVMGLSLLSDLGLTSVEGPDELAPSPSG
jgi:hypothetical protein